LCIADLADDVDGRYVSQADAEPDKNCARQLEINARHAHGLVETAVEILTGKLA
jgi:hypothetical protein